MTKAALTSNTVDNIWSVPVLKQAYLRYLELWTKTQSNPVWNTLADAAWEEYDKLRREHR